MGVGWGGQGSKEISRHPDGNDNGLISTQEEMLKMLTDASCESEAPGRSRSQEILDKAGRRSAGLGFCTNSSCPKQKPLKRCQGQEEWPVALPQAYLSLFKT